MIQNIQEFHSQLADKKITITELVQYYLANIEKKNKDLNIYLEVFEDALEIAKQYDAELENKTSEEITKLLETKKLFGVPTAVKDNILIKGKIASASSKSLENYVATYDATVIVKLREAGAIFLGRVNMDEFAMGGSTENSAYGVTKNPLNEEYVAGGSSGGSAAVISADMVLIALGSDTGGSIRQPAAYNGVAGLKPTYGSVSRHGLMAMASSFDVIGPFAKNIDDVQKVFEIIKGQDELDSTTHDEMQPMTKNKIKVGVPNEFIFTEGVSEEVKESIKDAIEKLRAQGVEVVDISIPLLKEALALYYILVPAEVSSNMARYDGIRYGAAISTNNGIEDYLQTRGQLLGPEVKRRIILGTYILSAGYHDAYYKKALILRERLTQDVKDKFKDVDVILTPTTPDTAFKIGEKVTDPLTLYLADIFTVTANLVGMPAISVPYKNDKGETGTENKMPLGLQFMSNTDDENVLFSLAKMV
ncbi:Asp-tRNA(Asn)/Glu-tRNA(Gln) amidotransferase subunit GatA [Candidatus Parcubacteria bacterium]|nr:Asp-tRNA(Asn)/Glu-tRNA(Gln) amidotransferase subunit GatA [Candidatus Parcubacteria bacterium]